MSIRDTVLEDYIISVGSFGLWISWGYYEIAPKAWPPLLGFVAALPAVVLGALFFARMRKKRDAALGVARVAAADHANGVITLERIEGARAELGNSAPPRFEDMPVVILPPRALDDPEVRKQYEAYVAASDAPSKESQ